MKRLIVAAVVWAAVAGGVLAGETPLEQIETLARRAEDVRRAATALAAELDNQPGAAAPNKADALITRVVGLHMDSYETYRDLNLYKHTIAEITPFPDAVLVPMHQADLDLILAVEAAVKSAERLAVDLAATSAATAFAAERDALRQQLAWQREDFATYFEGWEAETEAARAAVEAAAPAPVVVAAPLTVEIDPAPLPTGPVLVGAPAVDYYGYVEASFAVLCYKEDLQDLKSDLKRNNKNHPEKSYRDRVVNEAYKRAERRAKDQGCF